MSAVIEVRTYRAKVGMRERLLELLRARAFPLQRELGMKILGPFPSQDDEVSFVWLRGFPDEIGREPLKAAFSEGEQWLGGLEAEAMPLIDDYSTVLVADAPDLWSRWPAELPATTPENVRSATANFAVTLVRGPSWDESLDIREQPGWDGHAVFMDGLVADGFILVGGPVGDQRQTMHVVQAVDETDIRRRLAEDPWADAGLLTIGSIQPWALWLDFRTATRTPR